MEELFSFSPFIVAIIPVILGLVQIAKTLGLPSKYSPLLAILFGACLVGLVDPSWKEMIIQGIIAGLASSGLWSGVKTGLKTEIH